MNKSCPENCQSRTKGLAFFVATGSVVALAAACYWILPENVKVMDLGRLAFSASFGSLVFFPSYLAMRSSICLSCG